MASTVFILGAGASKDAGVPLMTDFLDVAHDLWKIGKLGEADKSFETVFRGISKLQLVHSKSQLDIQNIESVFASFEMAKILKRFAGDYTPEKIEELTAAMKSVIVTTIQETTSIQRGSGEMIIAPYPYNHFVSHLLKSVMKITPCQSVALITFNYDMALDLALHLESVPYYYGLDGAKLSENIPLLKLHGSLNWAECTVCHKITPVSLADYFIKYHWRDTPLFFNPSYKYKLEIGSRISEFPHEKNHTNNKEPLVVPPTWNKSQYHEILSSVWALAAKELSEAENIFIVGYSLPESDSFFRFLYALGTVSDTTLKRFWVFNPDDTGKVEQRFRELLGPGAIQRFQYRPNKFDESLPIIANALDVDQRTSNPITFV